MSTASPPPAGYTSPAGQPPDSYLVWAILTTIFCFLPLGIVSIVYATQVTSKWAMGDAAGAMDSSSKAKKWAIWSAVVAVVVYGGALLVLILIPVLLGTRR